MTARSVECPHCLKQESKGFDVWSWMGGKKLDVRRDARFLIFLIFHINFV